ncbi:MAG TPA: hypothetical protein GX708_20670 [Gallicola sp.]|nr:hypothetical protein [Gallicola sp.]
MTIDKIKFYMDEDIFNHWTALSNGDLPLEKKLYHLRTAKKQLEKEIESGILADIKHTAELNLINHLLNYN